jgi:hypothetical protein
MHTQHSDYLKYPLTPLCLQGKTEWRRVLEEKDVTDCQIDGLRPYTVYEVRRGGGGWDRRRHCVECEYD